MFATLLRHRKGETIMTAVMKPRSNLLDFPISYKETSNTLNFPANYQEVDAEDMIYVDGGAGANMIVQEWWGFNLYLSSTNANKVAGYLSIGAGVSGLIAIMVPAAAPVAGIIAGVLAIYAGAFYVANAAGRGVRLRYTYGVGFSGLYSQ